eukprot:CFRG2338T1
MKRQVRNSKNLTGPHVGIRRAKTDPRGISITCDNVILPETSTDPTVGVKRSISFKEKDIVKNFSPRDAPITCGPNYDPETNVCHLHSDESDDDLNFSFGSKLDLSNLSESTNIPNQGMFNLPSPKLVPEYKTYRMDFNFDKSGHQASNTAKNTGMNVWLKSSHYNFQKNLFHGILTVRKVGSDRNVTVRYTLDKWKNFKDVQASEALYALQDDMSLENYTFNLTDLHVEAGSELAFCIRYKAGPQEFWDSNDNNNYVIKFYNS